MKIFLDRSLVPKGTYLEIYQQILLLASDENWNQLNQYLITTSNANFEEPVSPSPPLPRSFSSVTV